MVDRVAPTIVQFPDSQPVRSTTVDSDGPTPYHSTIPIGVTECADQSVLDEVDDGSSDTKSVDSRNRGIPGTGGPITRVECQVWPQFVPWAPAITAQLESFSASFEWLAAVDMESLFTQRAYLLKSVPGFMKGCISFSDPHCFDGD